MILEDTIALYGKRYFALFLYTYQKLIWDRMFPTVHHGELPYVQGNRHYYFGIFLSVTIKYSIFSQRNSGFIAHTHTNTHMHH